MDLLTQARDWQQAKQAIALQLAGCAEGDQALADAKKIGALADEIERLRQEALDDADALTIAHMQGYAKAKGKCAALLSDWLKFAADVQPVCAAGADWLDGLRSRTMGFVTPNANVTGGRAAFRAGPVE